MRRCLYILLILLLPLRGWVGDAMATQMALPAFAAHGMAANGGAPTDHAAQPRQLHLTPASAAVQLSAGDCDGHGAVSDPGNPDDGSHCGECAACQTCNALAVLWVAEVPEAGQLRPALPQPVVAGFTSAERARILKPPTT